MIDFRYHLVSLVAVFLALAVGIALGAGPLRGELSTTIESQVSDLRDERAQLRSEIEAVTRASELKDDLIEQSTPRAVGGTLDETRVGVVRQPGADPSRVDDLTRAIGQAGGQVVVTTTVSEDLELAGDDADEGALASELAAELDLPEEEGEPSLSDVVAGVLAGRDGSGAPGSAQRAGSALSQAGLVDIAWAGPPAPETPGVVDRRPPDLLVVLSGGLGTPEEPDAEHQRRVGARIELVQTLGALGLPTVLVGIGADGGAASDTTALDPVVTQVRAGDVVADQISTVDNGETPSGLLASLYAGGWALTGRTGHWGLAEDADGPSPPPSPLRTPDTSTDDAQDEASTTSTG